MHRRRLVALVTLLVALLVPLAPPAAGDAAESSRTLRHDGEDVTILRTDYGVPHVYAGTEAGLFFGAGYAMAEDRLVQSEFFRRASSGRLAELGLGSVEDDIEVRRDGYTDAELRTSFAALPEDQQAIVEAYVDGINAFLASGAPLPHELTLLGITPDPWTELDVMKGAVYFVRRFGETGGRDLENLALLQSLVEAHGSTTGRRMFDDLFWADDPDAYATDPDGTADDPEPAFSAAAATTFPDVRDAAERVVAARERWKAAYEELGIPIKGGSNAIVVGPERSASGAPLLLGGPQMGYTIPQITHEIGLHGAGWDSEGMAFAGVSPFPLIGRGRHHAWTSTTGATDTVDHVIETLRPGFPTQYWHDGAWVEMEARTETFVVQGEPNRTETFYRTVHGPVVDVDPAAGVAIAVERAHWMGEPQTVGAFIGFNKATTPEEFEAAARLISTNHNFLYADDSGRTGYWMTGRLPTRPAGTDARLPRSGAAGEDWLGFTNIVDVVTSVDPDQGYLANWNNKPIAGWDNGDLGPAYPPSHRVLILDRQLAADTSISFEELLEINRVAATTSTTAAAFRTLLLDAVAGASLSPEAAAAVAAVAAWDERLLDADGDGFYDSGAPAVVDAWFGALRSTLVDDVIGGRSDSAGDGVLWRLLTDDPALPLSHSWLGGRSRGAAVAAALEAAVARLEADARPFGDGGYLQPVRVTEYRAIGLLPPPRHVFLNRGTYNQVLELAPTRTRAVNVNPPGQSGLLTPDGPGPHTTDQLGLYTGWDYKAQLLDVRLAPDRLAGADRWATSVAASQRFAPGVPVVHVANGASVADSTVAAAAAAASGGPLLLVRGADVPSSVIAELTRLRPGAVAVVGGTAAVSEAATRQLAFATGAPVRRLAGADRYSTAAAVAASFGAGVPVVHVVSGTSFADATVGAAAGGPLLLVPPSGLPADVAAVLGALKADAVVVIGGTAAVSDATLAAVEDAADAPTSRLAGDDRYATSAAVAVARGSAGDEVVVTNGERFADAAVAAALASHVGGPVVLVRSLEVPEVAADAIEALAPPAVTIVGGRGVLRGAAESQLESILAALDDVP